MLAGVLDIAAPAGTPDQERCAITLRAAPADDRAGLAAGESALPAELLDRLSAGATGPGGDPAAAG